MESWISPRAGAPRTCLPTSCPGPRPSIKSERPPPPHPPVSEEPPLLAPPRPSAPLPRIPGDHLTHTHTHWSLCARSINIEFKASRFDQMIFIKLLFKLCLYYLEINYFRILSKNHLSNYSNIYFWILNSKGWNSAHWKIISVMF